MKDPVLFLFFVGMGMGIGGSGMAAFTPEQAAIPIALAAFGTTLMFAVIGLDLTLPKARE